ncbi:hypothetical protein [Neolewinella antarctica]|uniref:DUF3592 domain-containing protein n=1 Tax=Neolewinella antarctica TaxID=442734 RepID=A0ABX0XFP5_9BACT|nr:hypothetical protein [Neolewinella antarctica]NJC28047.1 hypothetical protein [Neolewinella antarctica]
MILMTLVTCWLASIFSVAMVGIITFAVLPPLEAVAAEEARTGTLRVLDVIYGSPDSDTGTEIVTASGEILDYPGFKYFVGLGSTSNALFGDKNTHRAVLEQYDYALPVCFIPGEVSTLRRHGEAADCPAAFRRQVSGAKRLRTNFLLFVGATVLFNFWYRWMGLGK